MICWHRSRHSNTMTSLRAAVFLSTRIFFPQSLTGACSPQCLWDLSKIYESTFEIFLDVFIVGSTVKTGQSWCLAVTVRKRSTFEMQFHLRIEVSITDGDSFSRLPERRIQLACIEVLLFTFLWLFWSTLTKGERIFWKLVVGHEYKNWTSLECTQQWWSVEIKPKKRSQSRLLSGHGWKRTAYGAECWTMTGKMRNRPSGTLTRMLRAVLGVSWKEHKTNKEL